MDPLTCLLQCGVSSCSRNSKHEPDTSFCQDGIEYYPRIMIESRILLGEQKARLVSRGVSSWFAFKVTYHLSNYLGERRCHVTR